MATNLARIVRFWLHKGSLFLGPYFMSFVAYSCIANEAAVAQWCNPWTLQPEQSGGVGSIPDRTLPLERHDKGFDYNRGWKVWKT